MALHESRRAELLPTRDHSIFDRLDAPLGEPSVEVCCSMSVSKAVVNMTTGFAEIVRINRWYDTDVSDRQKSLLGHKLSAPAGGKKSAEGWTAAHSCP